MVSSLCYVVGSDKGQGAGDEAVDGWGAEAGVGEREREDSGIFDVDEDDGEELSGLSDNSWARGEVGAGRDGFSP